MRTADRVVAKSDDPRSSRSVGDEHTWVLPLARGGTPRSTPLEERAGVDALELLHHARRVVMAQLAPLKALHGPFGKWDARRKHLLAAVAVRVRLNLEARGGKVTGEMVDSEAHADPQYERVVDEGIADATRYHLLQTELDEIEERIRSREIGLSAYNAELRLQR